MMKAVQSKKRSCLKKHRVKFILNPYPWILEKNPERKIIIERFWREKIQSTIFYFVSLNCDIICDDYGFFPEMTLGNVPK